MFTMYRSQDPIDGIAERARMDERERTGEWPPRPDKFKLADADGGGTVIARKLTRTLKACVYDAIATHVFKAYRKKRLNLLSFRERLPFADDDRIRFRNTAVTILRDGPRRKHASGEEWQPFVVSLNLWRDCEPRVVAINTWDKSAATLAWLEELATSREPISGGMIKRERKGGKWVWKISLSRSRREGERRQVEPVPGRTAAFYCPKDQTNGFAFVEVMQPGERPWRMAVEAGDMLMMKHAHELRRRGMAANWRQSAGSAAHGRGLRRAIESRAAMRERYEARVDDWIENRSAAIVNFAVETQCESLMVEDLSPEKRNPENLRLGSFPYYKLTQRIQQKAAAAGIKTAPWPSIESLEKTLSDLRRTSSE